MAKRNCTKSSSVAKIVLEVMTAIETSYDKTKTQNKKELACSILSHIAKGADGVANTADDIIDSATLTVLQSLISSNQIGDLIDSFVNVAKGLTALSQQVKKTCPWFKRFCCGK